MRRDLDLVRAILVAVEDADAPVNAAELVTPDWPFALVTYHVELLQSRGLVDAKVTRTKGGAIALVLGLTWEGCDYLDAIRDERVWSRTKAVIAETVGSATMAVVKSTAVKVMTSLIDQAI